MRQVIALFTLLVLVAPAGAGLSWEKQEITVVPKAGERRMTVAFPFVNRGKEPVTIIDIATDCGCTVAEPEKETYQPGEHGNVTVVYTFGEQSGLQSKYISVRTGTLATPELTDLVLTVDLRAGPMIRPRLVYWQDGQPAKSKTITIRAQGDDEVTVTKVTCAEPGFDVELKTLEAGRSYDVRVTPRSTTAQWKGEILIEVDWPAGQPTILRAFARVYAGGSGSSK